MGNDFPGDFSLLTTSQLGEKAKFPIRSLEENEFSRVFSGLEKVGKVRSNFGKKQISEI